MSPALIGALQTGRNTVQATRINFGQQVRSAFGGIGGGRMGLQDSGNGNDAIVTPPEEGVAGPMGFWPFPVLNAIKGGGFGGGGAAPPAEVSLGVPSGIASIPAERGVSSFDASRAASGQRVW